MSQQKIDFSLVGKGLIPWLSIMECCT